MRRRIQARPKFYVIVIVLMVLFFGVSSSLSAHRLNKAAGHADALTHEKEMKEIEIRRLMEELEYVQSDEFIIRTARDKQKLIMPGEIRYTME